MSRCKCGARYDDEAFAALVTVDVVEGAALAAIVVHWPEGVVVDVRACRSCGSALSRLRRDRGVAKSKGGCFAISRS